MNIFKADIRDTAFTAGMVHPCKKVYVVNALKGDEPIDEQGYLVMVNENGDRIAYRTPGCEWVIDKVIIRGYNPLIPSYHNAIHVSLINLENK